MKITNRANLPEPLVRAVENDAYDRVGDISITQLIDPPQLVELYRQHEEEMTEDVSERIYALLGSAVHEVLARAASANHLQEERLTAQLDGWTISGKPDLLSSEGVLSDWKVTSVWSFAFGTKREWLHQLNAYAWLYRQAGFEVKRLEIVAILRDWMVSKRSDTGYPQAPALSRPIALWTDIEAEKYLRYRVYLHKQARYQQEIEPCTDEERWARADSWAVTKVGQKKAMAVFGAGQHRKGGKPDAILMQEKLLTQKPPVRTAVTHRPGENVRCESYCKASAWCPQFAALKRGANGATNEEVATATEEVVHA